MKKMFRIMASAWLAGFVGTASARLEDRGMVGVGAQSAHMIYDTDRDITWLDVDSGDMTWSMAMNWAANGTWGGYEDWRLPTTDPALYKNIGPNQTGSEMGHLFYTELGGVSGRAIDDTHKGNLFRKNFAYWSATELTSDTRYAWHFAGTGWQATSFKANALHALAVRDGDVAAATSAAPLPGAE